MQAPDLTQESQYSKFNTFQPEKPSSALVYSHCKVLVDTNTFVLFFHVDSSRVYCIFSEGVERQFHLLENKKQHELEGWVDAIGVQFWGWISI